MIENKRRFIRSTLTFFSIVLTLKAVLFSSAGKKGWKAHDDRFLKIWGVGKR